MPSWTYFVVILLLALTPLVPKTQANPPTKILKPNPGAAVPTQHQPILLPPNDWKDVARFQKAYTLDKYEANDPNAIKAYKSALGHGGRYDALLEVVSRKDLIESDHSPHYSLLNYLDNVADLPKPLKKYLELRKKLLKDFKKSDFDANEKRIAELDKDIEKMEKDFAYKQKKISVKDFSPNLKKEYDDKITEIKDIYRERKNILAPLSLENVVKGKLGELRDIRDKARASAIPSQNPKPTKAKLAQLDNWENEKVQLEATNRELQRPLDDFETKMKGKMGVLSLPVELHRFLPSTGRIGLNKDIEGLKEGTADEAKSQLADYKEAWKTGVKDALQLGYMDRSRPVSVAVSLFGVDSYLHALWADNFKDLYKSWTSGSPSAKTTFLKTLRGQYAKYWMTRVITAAKTKDFKELNKLYVTEYELYLGDDFDYYKRGIVDQLKASKEVGLLESSHVNELVSEHGLDKRTKNYDKWQLTQNLIDLQTTSQLSRSDFKKRKPIPRKTLPLTCFKLRGGPGDACIFVVETVSSPEPSLESSTDTIFPEVGILEDNQRIVSIVTEKLTAYLESFRGRDLTLDETRAREAVVELVGRHQDKLVGAEEQLRESKVYIKQELLNTHNNQVRLARSFGVDPDLVTSPLPVETLSNYDRVRVGSHNFVREASKLSGVVEEAGGAYGKIMLANGLVAALRNQDTTSLAILGGRVGLDVGFAAMEKTGSLMARKLGTEILVKIGSRMSAFVGKIAGPIGGLADIGISIYSISNSIRALNDPAASKWQQNDAIADVVSDSINIAITATTLVASVAFPPLAPVLAVVALIVNIIGGLAVSEVRASDHVAELNAWNCAEQLSSCEADLLGVRKDFSLNPTTCDPDSEVVFRVISKNHGIHSVVEDTCARIGEELRDLILLKNDLLLLFGEDEDLLKYLDLVDTFIDGQNQVYVQNARWL